MATKPTKRARTAPKPEPEATDEDLFVLVPGAGIDLRIKGQDYRLRKVRVGEWRDLNELRLANARKVASTNIEALGLPSESEAEQEVRTVALRAGRDLAYDLSLVWWSELFATVCTTAAMPDPRDLPGWATDFGSQEKALAHLIGPFDSGPNPSPVQ